MSSGALRFYKRWVSPAIHSLHGSSGACRFVPSCSEYAAGSVQQHGVLRGAALSAWRLLRCNPFSRGGFDPVPGTYSPKSHPEDSPLRAKWIDAANPLERSSPASETQR